MIDELQAIRDVCKEKPVAFCTQVLGVDPWHKQQEILMSVRDNPRTAVRSSHGVGKTFLDASAVLWFLFVNYPAVVITTAPTWRQVKAILWKEIHRLHKRMEEKLGIPLVAKVDELTTELRIDDSTFALGLATDEAEKFQGFHSENILVVADEASGLPPSNWEAINGVLTSRGARLLATGNPTQTSGEFFDAFHSKKWMYTGFHISAYDVLELPDYEARPYLVSKEWVEEKKKEWGEESALYQVRVLGEFPTAEADALIPLNAILEASQRDGFEDGVPEIGGDIARYGEDETVICVRRGDVVTDMKTIRQRDLMELANTFAQVISDYTTVLEDDTRILPRVRIDEVGIGAGVIDRLRQMGYRVDGINGGSKAYDYEKFADTRTEMYWRLRERFLERRICIPDDEILTSQLAALKHQYRSNGAREAIKIEAKESLRARGIKSPDRADALALAFMGSISSNGQTIMTSGQAMRNATPSLSPLAISGATRVKAEYGSPEYTERQRISSLGRRWRRF